MDNQSGNQYSTNEPYSGNTEDYSAGSPTPAFSGAFDDDSFLPAMDAAGQPVGQYAPPMYGQTAQQPYQPPMYEQPAQQYVPPVYGQPVQQVYQPPMYGQPVGQQYVPPMYGQPVGQYVPPMYGQPVGQQYVPPMYGQPVQQYAAVQPVMQYQTMPKEELDRKVFRKHCSRVGLMLMADQGLMFVVLIVVGIVAGIIFALFSGLSGNMDSSRVMSQLIVPIMLASGLSAIAGNMIPSSLHLKKWRYKVGDPFRGDKLSAGFILAALLTALGLNSAWCWVYYFTKDWFEDFVQIHPGGDVLYTPETMPLLGMIFYLIWVCVIAPVTEEYIFRGAILRTLSKYGAGFGIVASAFAFGLMHGNMGQTPMAFLIGLVMGYVAAKSGNIRQTIFIHFTNNVLASLPQIMKYFAPDWYEPYCHYVEYFDDFTMIFADSRCCTLS